MSETATTIIKLLSALTSPKAAVKYISVAASIVLSWGYLSNLAKSFGTPDENVSIVVLLAGVGVGSIVGQIISWFGDVIWQFVNSKIQSKRLAKQAREEIIENEQKKEKANQVLVQRYTKSFLHFDWEQKKNLRELTLRDVTLDLSRVNLKALLDNKYIKVVSQISRNTYLVTLNPAIFELTRDAWKKEIKDHVDEFFYDLTPEKLRVLELMEDRANEDNSTISVDIESVVSPFHSCIEKEAEDDTGFWLSFRSNYLSEFEERTNNEYLDEVWIDRKRIVYKPTGETENA